MRRQSAAQITGRHGERWFQSVLPPEWSIQRPVDDFGLDGIVAVGNSSYLTALEFGIQIKTSNDIKTVKKSVVCPRIENDVVLYWCQKLLPTLLVVYDAKNSTGFYEWIHNLVNMDMISGHRSAHYFHIDKKREISNNCWEIIRQELTDFHRQWSKALTFSRENVMLAGHLATLLRNLCKSQVVAGVDDEQTMLAMLLQSMTHEEVIRVIDELMPKIAGSGVVAENIKRFRDRYFEICVSIIDPFDPYDRNTKVLWMKPTEVGQAGLSELVDMLAECVSGLLGHMSRAE